MTQKTAVWTRLRTEGKSKKKSYFTLFFAFSPTAEPGPRLEWYRISQIFQLVYAFLSLVNSNLASEAQTHFQLSLLSLRKIGGREATTGNASALRRLIVNWLSDNFIKKLHERFLLNLAGYHVTQLRTDFEELCIRLTVESNHKISIVYRKTQNCLVAEFR